MPRKEKDKSPKKKTKEKSPKKREDSDPAMDEAEINRRLLKNALDQANAQHEQKLKELPEESNTHFQGRRIWEMILP